MMKIPRLLLTLIKMIKKIYLQNFIIFGDKNTEIPSSPAITIEF